MVLPHDLLEAVADGAEEQRAGIEDMALGVNSIIGR